MRTRSVGSRIRATTLSRYSREYGSVGEENDVRRHDKIV